MNQALPTGAKSSHAPDKVVYFATGAPGEVEADFERLRLACNGTRLRVVVPARYVRQVEQLPPLQGDEVLAYRPALAPLLWLRLWGFLGFSRRAEIVCLSAQERYRFLKFLALTLRGRVIFSPVSGKRVPLSPWALLVIWARQRLDAREQARRHLPIGVIGSASAFYLTGIVKVLRARYPGAPLHGLLLRDRMASSAPLFDAYRVLRPGLLPAVGEAWRMARSRRSYQRWVIPCTNEAGHALKLLAFLWPLSRRQIYNELGDGFAVRDVRTLWAHLRWRLRDHLSFQIVAGTAGKSAPARLAHLTLYALGLLRAAVLLGWVRLRGRRADWAVRPREAACERSTGERASGVTSDEETKTVGVGRSRGAVVVPQLPGGPSGPA